MTSSLRRDCEGGRLHDWGFDLCRTKFHRTLTPALSSISCRPVRLSGRQQWATSGPETAARVERSTAAYYDGRAYLGVVPFRMEGVRPRFTPSVPGLSAFPELNPNPVLEFSADGSLTYRNRAACELAKSLGVPEIGALLLHGTHAYS